jgi:PAS domain S-box-containing protein
VPAGIDALSLLRDILDALPDPVFAKDALGRYTMVNAAAARVIGRRADEVVGSDDATLFPQNAAQIREDDLPVLSGETRSFEETLDLAGVERMFLTSKVPWRGPDGEILGLIGVSKEITEQKRAEASLRESEERFARLVEASADMITVIDEQGVVRYDSPAVERILGWLGSERVGRSVFEYLHPDDVDELRRVFAEFVRSPGATQTATVRVRHAGGSWRLIEALGRNLLDDPLIRGVVVNARDVTERAALEERLAQAQKLEAIGRLAGGVAHDFNNLLTAVIGHAELLDRRLAPLAPERADLGEIRHAAQRAAQLTRQLLAFGRRQVGRPAPVVVSEVVADLEPMLRRLLGEDVELLTRLSGRAGAVVADRGQLEDVLLNLALNARDAMPRGGRLTIAVSAAEPEAVPPSMRESDAGAYVEVEVSDTGHGIERELLEHVFEPFFTTKEPGIGAGLGLASVYGMVKQAGGDVIVESEPDVGTTFRVFLPCGEAAPERSAAPPSSKPAARGSETILLVEDDDAVRRLIRRVLEDHGYEVLEAPNGAVAIDRLASHVGAVDLVITDVVMPGLSGPGLADRLAEQLPGVEVLYVSGYPDEVIAKHGTLGPDTELVAAVPARRARPQGSRGARPPGGPLSRRPAG